MSIRTDVRSLLGGADFRAKLVGAAVAQLVDTLQKIIHGALPGPCGRLCWGSASSATTDTGRRQQDSAARLPVIVDFPMPPLRPAMTTTAIGNTIAPASLNYTLDMNSSRRVLAAITLSGLIF